MRQPFLTWNVHYTIRTWGICGKIITWNIHTQIHTWNTCNAIRIWRTDVVTRMYSTAVFNTCFKYGCCGHGASNYMCMCVSETCVNKHVLETCVNNSWFGTCVNKFVRETRVTKSVLDTCVNTHIMLCNNLVTRMLIKVLLTHPPCAHLLTVHGRLSCNELYGIYPEPLFVYVRRPEHNNCYAINTMCLRASPVKTIHGSRT